MSRFLVIALIVSVLGLGQVFNAEPAYACSCAEPGTPSAELASSSAVFAGRVVSREVFPIYEDLISTADPTLIEFDVSVVWKGTIGRTMYVTTVAGSVSCGYRFTRGAEYIVYASPGGEQTVSRCSRTRLLDDAEEDLAELGEGHPPAIGVSAVRPEMEPPKPYPYPSSTPDWYIAIIAGVASLAIGLFLWLVWRRIKRRS